jgi:hypothetical protein
MHGVEDKVPHLSISPLVILITVTSSSSMVPRQRLGTMFTARERAERILHFNLVP